MALADQLTRALQRAGIPAYLDEQAAIQAVTAVKALCVVILDQKLGRALTTADIPAVQAIFDKFKMYYKFIVTNGL